MKFSTVRLLALTALTGVVACDDALNTGDLSEDQAQELAALIMAGTFSNSAFTPPSQVDGPAMAPVTYQSSMDTTVPCPLGGELAIDATIDYAGDTENDAFDLDYTMTQVHNSCVAESEEGNRFTVSGNPELSLDFLVESDGANAVDWSGGINGAITWATEGAEGTCAVDIDFDGSVNVEAESAGFSTSGTVCGHDVTQQLTVG